MSDDPETEIETLRVDLEIANAKADLALQMIQRLFQELFQKRVTEQTMTQLASVSYFQEGEESDPASALAVLSLRADDPDDPTGLISGLAREKHRLRRMVLDALRRDHQKRTP